MITSKTWIKLISLISIQLMSTQAVFGSYSDSNSDQAHVGDLESQSTQDQNQSPRMSRKKKCLIGSGLCGLVAAGAGAGAYFAFGNSNTPGIDSPVPTQSPTSSGVSPVDELNFPGIYYSSSQSPGQLSFDWLPLQGDDPEFDRASYELQYSEDMEHFDFDDSGVQSQELTENQEAKIEGLTPNSTVYFKIRAKLGNGTSIVPPQIYFNSSKTIAFEPKFHLHIFHKNLNQLGYKNISIDPDTETIMVENKSELEAITPGLFLTGLTDDGTGIFAMVTQVEQVGNELKISYYQPSLEQVFEEYHEVSNTAIVNPNAIPRNRRLESSNEPIGGTIPLPPINIPIEVESENKVANIKGALNSLVTIKLEALLTESRIKSAEFIIGGKHRLDLNFKYTLAKAGGKIVLDRDFFRKKFAHVNRFLKAASTARAAGGPLGLLIPKLELEAEFTLEAKGAVTLEAKTGGSLQHYNKISYNSRNGWVPDNRPPIWTVDAPKLPTIDVKASTSASLSLIPEANIGIGPLEFIEVEFGPFIKTGADAELSDAAVAGEVGAMHMTDLYLKSGVNVKSETEMTSWLGFGEATVLFDKDYFVTEHISFPEINMNTQCQSSSETNIVNARVVSTLKDGNRLPISKDAAYWYSKPNSAVQTISNGNSYDLTIDNGHSVYPVDVYRISQLKQYPLINIYNKTSILAGTCEAGEYQDDEITDDNDDENGENGKCFLRKPQYTVPQWELPRDVGCCSEIESAGYSEAPIYALNLKISEMADNFKARFDYIYNVWPEAIMQQANRAVQGVQGTWPDADAGLDSLNDDWSPAVIEAGNELINIYHIDFGFAYDLGDEADYASASGLDSFIYQSETFIERLEGNIVKINAGLAKLEEYMSVLVSMKSVIQSSSYPSDKKENDLVSIDAAIDLWQTAIDDVSTWEQKMNAMILEFSKLIDYSETGKNWVATSCTTECACKSEASYEADGALQPEFCVESFCNDCTGPFCD